MPEKEKVSILLVDDRWENLVSLRAILDSPDYDLVKACSGREALKQLMERNFALILLDVQMPILNGFETAVLIKAREKTRDIPIIFITGVSTDERFVYKGYDAGAVDYICKPIDPAILRSKVAVFADLFRKSRMIERQALLLHQAESRAREEKVLQEAIRLRDEFLSIASHELKTPLTPMKLQIQYLMRILQAEALPAESRPKVANALDMADRQISRLNRLVDELMDVARIQHGRLVLERERWDLSEIVEDVAARFKDALAKVGCRLEVDAASGLFGDWDRLRVEQVLGNLLANAMKYAPGQPIRVAARADGAMARLTVRDHGAGISREDQERIFQRFERGISPQRNAGGLGLGLYIVAQILHAHGGTIRVASEPGQGAKFIVTLPLAESVVGSLASAASSV